MKVYLYTPVSGKTFEAEWIHFPGGKAPFSVLKGHAPMISLLEEGTILWRTPEKEEGSVQIKSGVVRIEDDKIEICAE